jgi:hypothetical protein
MTFLQSMQHNRTPTIKATNINLVKVSVLDYSTMTFNAKRQSIFSPHHIYDFRIIPFNKQILYRPLQTISDFLLYQQK